MNLIPRGQVFVFLLLESGLYQLFLYGDLFGRDTIFLKYLSIALCALACIIWHAPRLVTAAMLLALGADTFLLVLDCHYALGVALFCGVQGLYLLRIYRMNGGWACWRGRICLSMLVCLMLWRVGHGTGLHLLAAVYGSIFLCSVAQSMALSGWTGRLFSAGLVLFFCCDLCVAASNLPEWLATRWYPFTQFGIWLYYLPGQVLIVLSALPRLNCVEEFG